MSSKPLGPMARQQYEELVANIDGIVWELDVRTFQFTFVSRQAERLLGYPVAHWFEPAFWVDHVHPDDRTWAKDFCLRATGAKRDHDFEYRMVAADGRTVWLRDIVSVVVEGDEAVRLRGIMVDITDRKRAEEELRAGEERFRQLAETIEDVFWITDPAKTRMLYVSPAYERIWGRSCQSLYDEPRSWLETIHRDDRERVLQAALTTQASGVYDAEYRIVRPDGTERWIRDRAYPVPSASGRVERVVGVARDITEQKRTEEALAAKEIESRSLAESSPGLMGTFYLRPDGSMCMPYTSSRLWDLFALRSEDVVEDASPLLARTHPDDVLRVSESIAESARSLTPWHLEYRVLHPTRGEIWLEGSTNPKPHPDGGVVWYGFVHDITDRKRAERALTESHSLLNAVVEGTSDAVFVKDLEGRYLMINSAGARFLGKTVEEVIGRDDTQLFTPDDARDIMERDRQVLASGGTHTLEETATAAGATRTFQATKGAYRDAQGKVVGLIGIARDVTEMKHLEAQFLQAQKMEAIGRLAGGVAHDFNNLLTVINGYGDLVFNRLAADDPSRELLAQMMRSGERAASLTGQLLAFSRQQVLHPRVVSLNVLLGELHKLLRPLIGEDIDLALVPDPALGLAKADPGQFEQAIINLAVNARDAMPQGGRLIIETHNAELDEGYAEQHPEVRPGRYVLVAVTDSGQGVDEATRTRIFEPFFTTKQPGKGTGLGLAMVYGFVKQSGGHIEVYSELGHGTTLKVYLPRAEDATPSVESARAPLEKPRGTETVLLVEDEDAVRALSRLVLQSSGYTVLEARDGQEAVWVAQQHQGPIHILVTDLVMPRMSGRQLADLLAKTMPRMRILFMSGYTDEAMLRHGVLEASVAFLQKPFTPGGLARKVREVLDTEAEGPS